MVRKIQIVLFLFISFYLFGQTEYDKIAQRPKSIIEYKNLDFFNGVKAPLILKSNNKDSLIIDYSANDYTLISFFQTYCSPCVKELPYLYQIDSLYENCNVYVITSANEFEIKEILKRKNINLNFIYSANQIIDLFKVGGYPKNYLIDNKGIIKSLTRGIVSPSDINYIKIVKFLKK